jgi:hypothetical protein
VFHKPLLLSRPYKRGSDWLSRLRQLVGFDEKQFSIPQPEKRFTTLLVGALTQHLRFTTFCSANRVSQSARIPFRQQVACQRFQLAETHVSPIQICPATHPAAAVLPSIRQSLPTASVNRCLRAFRFGTPICCMLDCQLRGQHYFDDVDRENA